jgi:CDP-diacylglycerol--glycerol-3-phosphate 3-phosphatidyltransferase
MRIHLNLPTILTLGRVAVIPLIGILIYMPGSLLESKMSQGIATFLFVLAAITDWLDGYLARRWGLESPFGAFLDPLADKLLVATCVIILVELGRLHPAIAVVIILREILVSALREWMAMLGRAKVVAVAMAGKVKTTLQLVGIGFLLSEFKIFGNVSTSDIGRPLMWVAAILTVWSMVVYLKAAFSNHDEVAQSHANLVREGHSI